MSDKWEEIIPSVNEIAEFIEIASDFGEPLEIVREAISNSFDAEASSIKIHFFVEKIDGEDTLIIEFEDNGKGMTKNELAENFWDLGNSKSKGDISKIGEKGHGTKIYLRSRRVKVIVHHQSGSWISICENPFKSLNSGELHAPLIQPCEPRGDTGTFIRIEYYNDNEMSSYRQNIVKDYINWFTKHGSFESEFQEYPTKDVTINLKCLDANDFEELSFGHNFAKENSNLNKLFDKHGTKSVEHYCKKYVEQGVLDKYPHIKYEAVIYVEGDQAKRKYNSQIRARADKRAGTYKVSDRYGIWLAKDFIPVQQVNSWISNFGRGSNAYVLLHGFINCQGLKLTANRGSIANTSPEILGEVRTVVEKMIGKVNVEMVKKDLFTLQDWQDEERTLAMEKAEFVTRKESISSRSTATVNGRVLLEPKNESEFFGLFTTIYTLFPDKFDFEPLDYNTTMGVDIIGRNKSPLPIADCAFWYIELKYLLEKRFNHSFTNIRWIVCWDFGKNINNDSVMISTVENEERTLKTFTGENGKISYFLEKPTEAVRITVIRLKEFLSEECGIEFE